MYLLSSSSSDFLGFRFISEILAGPGSCTYNKQTSELSKSCLSLVCPKLSLNVCELTWRSSALLCRTFSSRFGRRRRFSRHHCSGLFQHGYHLILRGRLRREKQTKLEPTVSIKHWDHLADGSVLWVFLWLCSSCRSPGASWRRAGRPELSSSRRRSGPPGRWTAAGRTVSGPRGPTWESAASLPASQEPEDEERVRVWSSSSPPWGGAAEESEHLLTQEGILPLQLLGQILSLQPVLHPSLLHPGLQGCHGSRPQVHLQMDRYNSDKL